MQWRSRHSANWYLLNTSEPINCKQFCVEKSEAILYWLMYSIQHWRIISIYKGIIKLCLSSSVIIILFDIIWETVLPSSPTAPSFFIHWNDCESLELFFLPACIVQVTVSSWHFLSLFINCEKQNIIGVRHHLISLMSFSTLQWGCIKLTSLSSKNLSVTPKDGLGCKRTDHEQNCLLPYIKFGELFVAKELEGTKKYF